MESEKTIEQLLELSRNPYFSMTNDEQKRLDDFLSKKSAQKTQQKDSGDKSDSSTPATVHNKNKVKKETGEVPKINDSADKQTGEQLEDPEYGKISEELASRPAAMTATGTDSTGGATFDTNGTPNNSSNNPSTPS